MRVLRYILGGLVGVWLILVLLAPMAEFAKIIMFAFVRLESKDLKIGLNSIVEYVYFLISFFVPWWIVTTNCCTCYMRGLTSSELKQKLSILAAVWIPISVVYTHFTENDIGEIPSSCPSDYPYPTPKLQSACIIRTTNFVIMWVYTSLIIVFLIAVYAGILPKEEDLKKKGKDFNIKTVIEGV